ncbi:MAG: hypothetical protein KC766_24460 [Myxococcales bacterium]|nr:hypothetical protein [Myxococcales bacterium]
MSEAAERASRRWLAVWLAVPLLGLCELGAQLWVSHRAPTESEWLAVAGPVKELRHPGDLIVVSPAWQGPNARHVLGDELMPMRDVARSDSSLYQRAIEISSLGEQQKEFAAWPVVERRRAGPFTLLVHENPSPESLKFDFLEELEPKRAEAYTYDPKLGREQRILCAFNANSRVSSGNLGGPPTFPSARFQCPGGASYFVGVTVIDDSEEYQPKRCIWANPTPTGPIGVTFRQVPLGNVIRGYGELPWQLEREFNGPPIVLTVRVAGQEIGRFEHLDGQGWRSFQFPLGAFAGRTEDVEFEVSSSNHRERYFCFQADSR